MYSYGYETTTHYVQGGDFYVYYTRDDGRDVVPRAAIRTDYGKVAEVRGIADNQELEPLMADAVAEQLKDLEGGDVYIQKAEDMKRVTRIHALITSNSNAYLSKDDVRFLYELDRTIEGFGYHHMADDEIVDQGRDPRVDEIRALRGDLDHAELKTLVIERMRENFETSYAAYDALVGQLQSIAIETPMLTQGELQELYNAKMSEWQERGVLDYVAERFIDNGESHTPIFRPNVIVPVDGFKTLAHNLARMVDSLGDKARIDPVLDGYVTEQEIALLSGYKPDNSPVNISLIPSKEIDSSDKPKSAEEWLTVLADLQKKSPQLNFNIPSMLDAFTFWHVLRIQGNGLFEPKNNSFDLVNLPPQLHNNNPYEDYYDLPVLWIGDEDGSVAPLNTVFLEEHAADYIHSIRVSLG